MLGEKARRLHGGLIAVVEIAGEEECVHLLIDAQLDDAYQDRPAGVADQLGEPGFRRASERSGESSWISAAWTKR
jgi:hypothetical protein